MAKHPAKAPATPETDTGAQTPRPDIADSMLPKPKPEAEWPFPESEHTPTREEAREMFKANPGLWSVLTTEGNITRDQC